MSIEQTNRSGLTSLLKRAGKFAAVSVIVLVALYALTPLLVTQTAPHLAARFGLELLEVEIKHPRWRGINIKRLVVATDQLTARSNQARIDYSWSGLRTGRVDRLNFSELEILLPSAKTHESAAGPPNIEALFPADLVQHINVERLLVKFPDTGFIGVGEAQLGDGLLKLSLDGVEPDMASNFSITAELLHSGQFQLQFGERQDGASEFLRINGQIGSDSIGLDGSVSLSGLPLRLTSELVGLPQGSGTVSGTIHTQLSWPLPDQLNWKDIVATVPEFSIDWQSAHDDLKLNLSDVSGSVQLQNGEVEANVSGALRYWLEDREFTVQLPAAYKLKYKQAKLSGTEGPRLTIKDTTTDAAALLHSFSLRRQPEIALDVDADIDARVNDLRAVGRVRGTLEGDSLNLEGALKLNNKTPRPHGKFVGLANGSGTFKGTIQTRLPSPLPDALVWQNLTATIPSFGLDWQSAAGDLKLTALAGSAELKQGDVSAMVAGQVRYRQSEHTVNFQLPKNYRLNFHNKTLTGGKGLKLSLKEENKTAVATLRSFTLLTAPKTRLDIDAGIDMKVDTLSSIGQLKARVTADDTAAGKVSGRFDYTGAVQASDQRHDGNLSVSVNAVGESLTATGTLNSGLFHDVPLALNYNFGSGAGHLQAAHTFEFRQSITASLIPGWSAVYDFDAGRIATELKLNWSSAEAIGAHLTAKLTDVRAHYEDYLATGISGNLNFRADDISKLEEARLEPAMLRVERVDVGFPLDNLVFSVAWSGDDVAIQDASLNLLGGEAIAAPFVYVRSKGSAAFELQLKGIDLATVLALEGDDITGMGKLSGTLPIIIDGNKPRIESGLLTAALPGGYLRLSPKLAATSGEQSLMFALTALKDFTYTELTTNIDYAENGDLALGVHLKGHNPAVEKGRAIHYNLNINENVPVLLESLRLTDKLNERLEQKLKK